MATCWASVERTEVKDWEEDPIPAVATCWASVERTEVRDWEEDPIHAVATCWASVERTEVRDWEEEDPLPAVTMCAGRVLSGRRSKTGKRTLSLQWPRVLGEC